MPGHLPWIYSLDIYECLRRAQTKIQFVRLLTISIPAITSISVFRWSSLHICMSLPAPHLAPFSWQRTLNRYDMHMFYYWCPHSCKWQFIFVLMLLWGHIKHFHLIGMLKWISEKTRLFPTLVSNLKLFKKVLRVIYVFLTPLCEPFHLFSISQFTISSENNLADYPIL